MTSACFTGHRSITSDIKQLQADMYDKLERAIKNGGIANFFAGGAIGFDTEAAKTVIALREVYPQITLNLILPCCAEDQTQKWTEEQRKTYYDIRNRADSVEYTADRYYNGCMQKRNARLVELAEFCFCYWDSTNQRSGTAQTVKYALNKPIQVWNFYNNRLEK
jgi:uncharacterized phage-like protein YoqJ